MDIAQQTFDPAQIRLAPRKPQLLVITKEEVQKIQDSLAPEKLRLGEKEYKELFGLKLQEFAAEKAAKLQPPGQNGINVLVVNLPKPEKTEKIPQEEKIEEAEKEEGVQVVELVEEEPIPKFASYFTKEQTHVREKVEDPSSYSPPAGTPNTIVTNDLSSHLFAASLVNVMIINAPGPARNNLRSANQRADGKYEETSSQASTAFNTHPDAPANLLSKKENDQFEGLPYDVSEGRALTEQQIAMAQRSTTLVPVTSPTIVQKH